MGALGVDRLLGTDAEAPAGQPLALIGSHGYLEGAVLEVSAGATSGARGGDEVRVQLA